MATQSTELEKAVANISKCVDEDGALNVSNVEIILKHYAQTKVDEALRDMAKMIEQLRPDGSLINYEENNVYAGENRMLNMILETLNPTTK